MKRIAILLLALVMLAGTCLAANPFTDVAETDYFYEPVLWALENGITTGKTETTFDPTAPCSRAQVVTFLWRLKGKPQPTTTTTKFTDTPSWKYYYPAICWAVENGITTGITETVFEPERSCTQGQLATFLWRTLGQPEPQSAELVKKHGTGKFYSKASAWMEELGAIEAIGGVYYPMGISARSQIVTFMYFAAKQNTTTVAESFDSPTSSMVRIKARPDFTFRKTLKNADGGEQAPIEKDYYLCAYKVTNAEYADFVKETGHRAPNYWKNGTYPEGKDDHPVLNVSYSDAERYCKWLNAKCPGWNFRLPTEAEWENAAMGTYYGDETVKYPHGNQTPQYNAKTCEISSAFNYNGVIAAQLMKQYGKNHIVNYVKGDFAGTSEPFGECITISATGGVTNWANHGGDAKKGYFLQTDLYATVSAEGGNTSPVGAYPANTLGLYDMAGNAWDLTSSVVVAENGLEKGVSCYAVRGGSWYATARSCTFFYRGEGRKDSPSSTVGFRLAADCMQ